VVAQFGSDFDVARFDGSNSIGAGVFNAQLYGSRWQQVRTLYLLPMARAGDR
jgi:hypothetical protein